MSAENVVIPQAPTDVPLKRGSEEGSLNNVAPPTNETVVPVPVSERAHVVGKGDFVKLLSTLFSDYQLKDQHPRTWAEKDHLYGFIKDKVAALNAQVTKLTTERDALEVECTQYGVNALTMQTALNDLLKSWEADLKVTCPEGAGYIERLKAIQDAEKKGLSTGESAQKDKSVLESKQSARQGGLNVLKRGLAWMGNVITVLLAGISYDVQKISRWFKARAAAKKGLSEDVRKTKNVTVKQETSGDFVAFAESWGNPIFLPGYQGSLVDKPVKPVKPVKPKKEAKTVSAVLEPKLGM